MTNSRLFWCLICLAISTQTASSRSSLRDRLLFDDGWRFHLGDLSNAKNPSFDDGKWRPVDLPHDWSIEADFDSTLASCTGYLPGGFGWYRKTFDIPGGFRHRTIGIQFDGVYCNSEVWINGNYLGKHPYGFTGFCYNLTPYVEFGKKNVIAVRIDHMKYADTRWYSGSGIYRHVWLIATSKVHVAQWGTQVMTTDVTPSQARATVISIVAADDRSRKGIKVLSTVLNKDGKVVASAESGVELSDSLTPVSQSFIITKPVLWDPDNPYLYALRTRIISGTDVVDEYETPFGIRTIRFDPNGGFFLNGVNTKIKGVCLHSDAGCLGAVIPEKVWRIRIEKLKATGCNAIRTSHNPVAPELLDMCDQMGLLVMEEAFDEWEYPKRKWINGWNQTVAGLDGYPDIFEQCCENDLIGMVHRDRNHPSIFMWSIGNEIDGDTDPYADPASANYRPDRPDVSRIVEIARRFVTIVKTIDTSRPVTMAMANVASSNKAGLPGVLDIAGYNYTEAAYQNDHTQYPNRIIYGSENSHSYGAWLAVKNNDFISAQFLWTGIDYMGEAGKFPIHAATSGLLDLTSFEKPLYYWRQAMWAARPMLYLASRRKKPSDGQSIDPMSALGGFSRSSEQNEHWNYSEGDSVVVMAFSNCGEVELFLNGKSLGRKKSDPRNSCKWWIVPYEPGEVVATSSAPENKKLKYASRTVSEPARIALKPDVMRLKASDHDIAIVEVQLLDKNNNRALLASNVIEFELSGEGRIIGVDNGDVACKDNYKSPRRAAHLGRCVVFVQAGGRSGNIRLTARSAGLPDASVDVRSE